ncbi:hypothetical protein AYJ57_18090 [Salipiger sp. CCB-MM3]|uniref:hypothetical protein n=1 Tax=Salipiger sp. CCB-MM3 TaxID=1792508 RepID=UPI00080AB73D|nr:hypothetical protein [Salipiger sp. CCB-MM3]ANT62329.1 hypothetical protein AYJ57_18090 [Salipiger sp. CCB-MM3]
MNSLWTVVLSLAMNLLALAVPLALLQVYDRILPNQSIGTAVAVFSVAAICVIAAAFLRYVRSAILGRLGAEAEYRLWMRVVRGAFALPSGGDLTAAQRESLFAAPQKAQDALVGQALLPVYDAPFGVLFLALVWFLGGPIVMAPLLVVAAALLAIAVTTRGHSEALKVEFEKEGQVDAQFAQLAGDGGGALRRGREAARFEELFEARRDMAEAQRRIDRVDGLLTDITQSASLVVMLLLLGIGAGLVLGGDLTSGGLAACTLLGSRGTLQVIGFAAALVRRKRAQVALRQLSALPGEEVAVSPEVAQSTLPLELALEVAGRESRIAGGEVVVIDAGGPLASGRTLKHVADCIWDGRPPVTLVLDGRPVRLAQVDERVRFLTAQPELIDGTLIDNISRFDPALIDDAMALSRDLG